MKNQTESLYNGKLCCKEASGRTGIMRPFFQIDRLVALVLAPFVLVVLAILFPVVVACQGRPFIFRSERMRGVDEAFLLYKIRSMHPPDPTAEQSVLGGDLSPRVTAIGSFLRRSRLDELPQIFNVLKGDMRFIGPRPPLRKYVETFRDLYAEVLADTPPGITGLATVTVHAREERLLSACRTADETDFVYRTRCIPVKARLDLIYRDNRGPVLNAMILYRTFTGLPLRGIFARRATGRTHARRVGMQQMPDPVDA